MFEEEAEGRPHPRVSISDQYADGVTILPGGVAVLFEIAGSEV
jgi:hypothetical protein